MGKGSRIRERQARERAAASETFLQQCVYDDLFATDPLAANLFLLVLEIEDECRGKGVKPSFCDFSGSGAQLSEFMDRNRDMLMRLFEVRFKDPAAYTFPGKMKSGFSGSIIQKAPL